MLVFCYDKIPEMTKLSQERFILTHGIRGFNSCLAASLLLDWWHGRKSWPRKGMIFVHDSYKGEEGLRKREGKGPWPRTYLQPGISFSVCSTSPQYIELSTHDAVTSQNACFKKLIWTLNWGPRLLHMQTIPEALTMIKWLNDKWLN